MLSLKPADDSEEVVVLQQKPSTVLRPRRTSLTTAGRRVWSRLTRTPLVGLDIGTGMVKAVLLNRVGSRLELSGIGYVATPPEALTSGVLTDSVVISDRIRSLFRDYRIRGKRVAVAAGDEKVLCQTEQLGWTSPEERLALIEQSVASTVPYPISSAAIAFEEIEKLKNDDGVLFWACAPSDRVDWFRETAVLAGKTPAIVDLEACALANAVIHNYRPEPAVASLLLHVGVQKVVIGLLIGDRLEYGRSNRLSRIGRDQEVVPFPDRVTGAMNDLWETILHRAKPLELKQVYLSGGPVQVEKLGEIVHSRSGLPVIEVNPFRKIECSPTSESGKLAQAGRSIFSVAVGLALRGFDDA